MTGPGRLGPELGGAGYYETGTYAATHCVPHVVFDSMALPNELCTFFSVHMRSSYGMCLTDPYLL